MDRKATIYDPFKPEISSGYYSPEMFGSYQWKNSFLRPWRKVTMALNLSAAG